MHPITKTTDFQIRLHFFVSFKACHQDEPCPLYDCNHRPLTPCNRDYQLLPNKNGEKTLYHTFEFMKSHWLVACYYVKNCLYKMLFWNQYTVYVRGEKWISVFLASFGFLCLYFLNLFPMPCLHVHCQISLPTVVSILFSPSPIWMYAFRLIDLQPLPLVNMIPPSPFLFITLIISA